MRKLPKILKKIIKKKRFSLNSLTTERDWRGGMKIDYRITMVKADQEMWYEALSPLNNKWGHIHVNIKVKGSVEMRARYSEYKSLVEIGKATRTKKSYWGGYETSYDCLWGGQANKGVRREIRTKVQDKVKDFLKLLGITSERAYDGITIKTISWEK